MGSGARGGTLITVYGAGFDPEAIDYFCGFKGTATWIGPDEKFHEGYVRRFGPYAPAISFTEMRCLTPAWNSTAETATMGIFKGSRGKGSPLMRLEGTDSLYDFFECWDGMDPRRGSVFGGTMVNFDVYGFDTSGYYYAKFYDPSDTEKFAVTPSTGTLPHTDRDFKLKSPDWASFVDGLQSNTTVEIWHNMIDRELPGGRHLT